MLQTNFAQPPRRDRSLGSLQGNVKEVNDYLVLENAYYDNRA